MVRIPAVISNDLEAANHLTDGEETKQLRDQDAAADELRPRGVPDLLDERRGWVGGLQQGTGVLEGAQGAVEVALEGGDRSVWYEKKERKQ